MSRDMPHFQERPAASVVAFPRDPIPRFRRPAEDGQAPRGEILLFTGVRYERMPEPKPASPRLLRRRS